MSLALNATEQGASSMAEYSYGVSDLQHIALYRQKAEECRQRAENCSNSRDKEMWLRLAEDWTTMAQEIERRLSRG
jgi:hypothetical protein